MKICYINPTILIRRPLAELVDLLGDQHEVTVFLPRKPFKKTDQSWHSNEKLKKAKIYSYAAINPLFINFEWPIPVTPMFFINLWRSSRNADVIHMWTYFYINSWAVLLYQIFFKRKLILTADTFPAYSFKSGRFIDFLFRVYTRLFGKIIFGIPDRIHIYGNSLKSFAKQIGIPEKKIIILPTGIQVDKFQINPKKAKINQLTLFYAGLLVPRKGIDIMLKSVALLQNSKIRIKLLLVGEGPAKNEYVALAKKLNVNVEFRTWTTDMNSLFEEVDVLFLPSRGEGLPGIVMETMASGLPVIASDIPCINELVVDHQTGFLCEMDNIPQFADKIEVLFRDPKLRVAFGKAGRKKIEKFDWTILKSKYLQMYSSSSHLEETNEN